MLSITKKIKFDKSALTDVDRKEDNKKQIRFHSFSYGSQYYRAPTPRPEEWEDDICTIAQAGYNVIQLRPQWRWHERQQGRLVWDDIDRLVELIEKHDIEFIIKPMLECAPDWVYTDLDGTRIGFNKIPIPPKALGAFYVGGWLPCFDNPQVRDAAVNFTRELVKRYKTSSKLLLWNAWNEPRSRPLGECQCAHSARAYRAYLQKRFKAIENLNEYFGKAWTAFETIIPPASGRDYAEMYLWRQWAFDAVSQRVKTVADCIRKEDPDRKVMAHVGCSLIVQDTACDSSDDHANASMVDFYGCSLPVQIHPSNLYEIAETSMQCDWLRSVDENYWCHELYPNWEGWNRPPAEKFLNRVVWNVIACGAKGIVYWQYRSERLGNETNGHGLREIDGSATIRSEVAEGIAEILQKEGKQILDAKVQKADVAIFYCKKNDLLSRIKRMREPLFTEDQCYDYDYKTAVHGAYLGYWNFDIRTDWVSSNQLERLNDYKYIFISKLELVNQDIADKLREYVSSGGCLILEFPFACRQENTWVIPKRPGFGLDELIGGVEKQRIDGESRQMHLPDGKKLDVGLTSVIFEPRNGQAVGYWQDDEPALIKNKFGKGTVYAIGASLAYLSKSMNADTLQRNWSILFENLNIKTNNQKNEKWVGLETRYLRGPKADYLILMNHVARPGTIALPADFAEQQITVITGHKNCIQGNLIEINSGEVICIKKVK